MEKILGIVGEVKYDDEQKGDVSDTLAEISLIEKEFNWNPKINIEQGLDRYINWTKLEDSLIA